MVGALATLLVVCIIAVVIGVCYIFGRKTADGQAFVNLHRIRYHRDANNEGKLCLLE